MFFSFIYMGLILTTSSVLASEVCGTNLITYGSAKAVFELEESGINIGIVGFGSCEKVCVLRDPICGSDARTYYNYCHLVFAYRRGEQVAFLHPGPCGIAGEYVGPPGNKPSVINNVKKDKTAYSNLPVSSNIIEKVSDSQYDDDSKDLDLWTRVLAGDYVEPPGNTLAIFNNFKKGITALDKRNIPTALNVNKEAGDRQGDNESRDLDLWTRVLAGVYVDLARDKPSHNSKKGKNALGYPPIFLNVVEKASNSQDNDNSIDFNLWTRVMAKKYKSSSDKKPSILNILKKDRIERGNLPFILNNNKGTNEYNQAEIHNLEQFLVSAVAGKYLNEADLYNLEQFLIRDVEKEKMVFDNQPDIINSFKDATIREDDETDTDDSKELTLQLRMNLDDYTQSDYDSRKQDTMAKLLRQGKTFENNTHTIVSGQIGWPFKGRMKVESTAPIENDEESKNNAIARSYKKRIEEKRSGDDALNNMQLNLKFKLPQGVLPSLESAQPVINFMKRLGK